MQEETGSPSRSTVQVPQRPTPQVARGPVSEQLVGFLETALRQPVFGQPNIRRGALGCDVDGLLQVGFTADLIIVVDFRNAAHHVSLGSFGLALDDRIAGRL